MVKVKILILFAIIAAVACVPFKQTGRTKEQSMDFKNFIHQQSLRNSVNDPISKRNFYESLLIDSSDKGIMNWNATNFRLPNNTIPSHYDLFIRTDIHAGYFGFSGTVRINIRAIETSNFITLHSIGKSISSIRIFNADGSIFQEEPSYTIDSFVQFLNVRLERNLLADQEYVIEISYSGLLSSIPEGFYSEFYFDEDTNVMFWSATTHFQPTFARYAFPCYDEVRYRTTFDVRIQHHNSYNAISNMPISSIEENENNFVTSIFERTLAMPTYLLAFSVSNFDFVQNTDVDLPMRVYARPAAIASGQADVPLELSERYLRTMEEYFEIPYTLPKSDVLANLRWRESESWGLIMIDEFWLLEIDQQEWRNNRREAQLAREYSHNYFGNLVSISEWSYLWLNEGFATLYENFFNDMLFPEKMLWENFLIGVYDFVVDSDSFWTMSALNEYAETPSEIRSKFNLQNTWKGAVVLRMFQEAFTRKVFLLGVKNFLNEMQMGSASPEDLYAAMQRAWDEMNVKRPLDVAQMMRPWFDQAGIPLVTVSRTSSGLRLTQEEFGPSHTDIFNIPISYATASTQNFDDTSAEFWLTTNEMEISRADLAKELGDNDWVIFNIRDTGYYVTNYDDKLWRLIIDALLNDHEAIHFLNRGTLFADFHRLIQQNIDVSPTIFLEMVDSLKLEMHPHVWARANIPMRTFERLTRGTNSHPLFLSFLQDIMTPIYGRTFDNERWPVDIINHYSCLSGVHACLDNALSVLREVMETGSTSYPFSYRCNGFLAADEATWMHFFDRAMATNDSRWFEFADLGCTQNKKLQEFYLNQALNASNNLRSFEREDIFMALSRQNQMGWENVVEFIENRTDEVVEQLNLSSILFSLASGVTTEDNAERILALLDVLPPNISRQFLRQIMEPNLRFTESYSEEIHEWLVAYERDRQQ